LIEDETVYKDGRPSERAALRERARVALPSKPPFSEGLALFKENLVSYEAKGRRAKEYVTLQPPLSLLVKDGSRRDRCGCKVG
jgi:hypothetical protein